MMVEMPATGSAPHAGALPVELEIDYPDRQRRWTVLLRALLVIPHWIILSILGIAVFFVAITGWVCALFLQRLPAWAADFLAGYVQWNTRVMAYFSLLVDRYPPFSLKPEPSYVVRPILPPALTPADQVGAFFGVLFRAMLYIPAGIVSLVLRYGWYVLCFFFWLIIAVLGRVPRPVFEATAAALRYTMWAQCYLLLLTPSYPKRLFGDAAPAGGPAGNLEQLPPSTRPLLLSGGGRALLGVLLALGVLALILLYLPGILASMAPPAAAPS